MQTVNKDSRAALGIAQLAIPRRSDSDPVPLSFAQQRLWLLHKLEPHTSQAYNVPVAFQLDGELCVSALRRSISEVILRHEVFRTVFQLADESPAQIVRGYEPRGLSIVDLRQRPLTERRAEALKLAAEEARRPFDFSEEPLLRVTLYQLEEREHLLLIVTHHLAVDGISLIDVLEEFSSLYEGFLSGTSSQLAEPAIQYADFALWQRRLRGSLLDDQLSFWKNQLAGASSTLELPTDYQRLAVRSHGGRTERFTLSEDLSNALRKLSHQEGVTLFTTLLAAFQTLLHRYTNQEDITVGTVVSNRSQTQTDGVVGPLSNTLPLRTDLSGDPAFCELLARVHKVTLEAYGNQDIPFERLVEELRPQRELNRSPLFQTLFVLHETSLDQSLKLPKVVVTSIAIDLQTSRFDLSLEIQNGNSELSGSLEYDSGLFHEYTITRMTEHLRTLLQAIVSNAECRISELQLLTEAERYRLLVEWNDTATEFSGARCVHQLFEAQVQRNPNAIAIEFERKEMSYRALNNKANQVAHYLMRLGVGPGHLVGICVERSFDMFAALLGILKAGAAYVPLDPAYPQQRLSFMVDDADVAIILSQKRLIEKLPASTARVVCLDTEANAIGRESDQNPEKPSSAEDLAYVIYTSGSSGKPKGVQIPHQALANFVGSMGREPGLNESDVLLAITTVSFDMAVLELYLPLVVGARIVLASGDVARDGAALARKLAECGATVFQATPTTWQMLLERGWLGDKDLKIICGAEPLSTELAGQLLDRCGSFWNMYGPTETTVWSTVHRVRSGDVPVPVGRPIANTKIYILDRHQKPVPIGVPGEIHIGGLGVALGYLNRPDLTTEKFLANPFDVNPNARLYKTGDIGRYLSDGSIEFLGRLDHQVKIRGHRIELGEIEAVLRRHPAVKEAVVVVREDDLGDKRLVAYVTSDAGETAAREMRESLRRNVPEFMVPSKFVFLELLPRTPNGKLDRSQLPAPDYTRADGERGYDAPRDALELQLTRIWEKSLRVRPIGIRDDFFDLGGNSLLAVTLFERIEKLLGRRLPLAVLFQARTIEQLACILRQEGWSADWSSLVPMNPGGSSLPFFCIHALGGNVLSYADLARHLGPDQPFYGLQAQGLDGKRPRHRRVEEMAEHYIKEIRQLQPEGPYYLGGASFGGMIAFEMAQQLHAQGQSIALLALFDTYGPGYPRQLPTTTFFRSKIASTARRLEHHIRSIWISDNRGRARYLAHRAIKARNWLLRRVSTTRKALKRGVLVALKNPLPQHLQATQNAIHEACSGYEPTSYPGRLVLFRAQRQPWGIYEDPTLGWQSLAGGGLEVHEVPGYHSITIEPYVRFLAAELRPYLPAGTTAALAATEARETEKHS